MKRGSPPEITEALQLGNPDYELSSGNHSKPSLLCSSSGSLTAILGEVLPSDLSFTKGVYLVSIWWWSPLNLYFTTSRSHGSSNRMKRFVELFTWQNNSHSASWSSRGEPHRKSPSFLSRRTVLGRRPWFPCLFPSACMECLLVVITSSSLLDSPVTGKSTSSLSIQHKRHIHRGIVIVILRRSVVLSLSARPNYCSERNEPCYSFLVNSKPCYSKESTSLNLFRSGGGSYRRLFY